MTANKYVVTDQGLLASRRSSALAPASLLVADRVARFYDWALPVHARGVLADLGCGASPLRAFYTPMVERVWSIDWPGSLHRVRLDVFGDLTKGLPLKSRTIDTIVVSDVLEHLADPGCFLSECHRVLRPGGTIIGNVPFLYRLHEEPHDYYRYTEHGLGHLLTAAGLAEVEVRRTGGGADVLVDVATKLATGLPVVGRIGARLVQRAWLGLTSEGGERPSRTKMGRALPLGYGFVATRIAD